MLPTRSMRRVSEVSKAGAERRWAKPVGPAGEVSCAGGERW